MNSSRIRITLTNNCISKATKDQMWDMYQPYYSYKKSSFLARFDKNTHYALYHKGEELVGFTGIRINEVKIDGKEQLLIYFGQTVVTHACRGKNLIQRTGMQLIRTYWKHIVFSNAWFWADALSYKAYMVFAKSLNEFYPTRQYATPESVKSVIDFIGSVHYHGTYCAETGTVRKDVKYVTDPSSVIRPEDQQHPDIAFFATANPKSKEGHGLITLAPISGANVRRLIRRSLSCLLKKFTRRSATYWTMNVRHQLKAARYPESVSSPVS
ncbi:MAG: hypothetical protein AAF587_22620 [Bacteroidota bacterium]